MANTSNTISADKTVTLEEFIALRSSDEITYYNYSILQYLNGYDMFITNLLYDYEEEFESESIIVELTDIERNKYMYKPYLFAFDIYGSTESRFIIMMLNGIIDPKDFNFKKIKVLRYSALINLLNRIQAVNEDYLNNNREILKSEFKSHDGNDIWTE